MPLLRLIERFGMGDASTFDEPFAAVILALLILRRSTTDAIEKAQLLRRVKVKSRSSGIGSCSRQKWLYRSSVIQLGRTKTMRGFMRALAVVIIVGLPFATAGVGAEAKQHRLAIQVNQNDPDVMNLALNNATNVIEYYRDKGEGVQVEIVTYGPGLHMLRADSSPVQDRIKRLAEHSFPAKITFAACNNTKRGMEKREGKAISIIPEAMIVPSGVVQLMELQEQGWSYI
jgi:intracellular sulfur oxidation DsrE/DsrF family protein